MPTVTVARSDLFPVGTSVSIYPANAASSRGDVPRAAAIASGTVGAAGSLSVTNAGLLQGVGYVAGALIGESWRYVRVRSTLDVQDTGKVVGTADTTSGSFTLLNASASSGSFQIGQRISGAGIKSGTLINNVVGGTLAIDQAATATANGVAIQGEGGKTSRARWMARKAAIGTT